MELCFFLIEFFNRVSIFLHDTLYVINNFPVKLTLFNAMYSVVFLVVWKAHLFPSWLHLDNILFVYNDIHLRFEFLFLSFINIIYQGFKDISTYFPFRSSYICRFIEILVQWFHFFLFIMVILVRIPVCRVLIHVMKLKIMLRIQNQNHFQTFFKCICWYSKCPIQTHQ